MAMEVGKKLSIKLLVDKDNKRVLFAEAGKDFVDFLFHIMTLPIGTVIRLLENNDIVGCVGNVYRSILNISNAYMATASIKEALLKPMSPPCEASFIPYLLPNSSPSARKTYYKCSVEGRYNSHYCCPNVVDQPNVICSNCQSVMTQRVVFLETEKTNSVTSLSSGYVKEVVTYMVMDNLEVKPMSTISGITILNRFNVKDVGSLEEKVVDFGMNEALRLLKTSLYSKNVLTDLFFGKV